MAIEANPSTVRLMDRAAAGDDASRQDLLESQRAGLRAAVAARLDRRLGSRLDPSDIVQEALFDASQRLDNYLVARPIPFFAWLRQIAWDRIVDAHRWHLQAQRRSVDREVRQVELQPSDTATEEPLLPAPDTSPSDRLQGRERVARIMDAMATLSPRDRDILRLRHLEQRSTAEIAATLGISVKAAEVRLARALARLRTAMEGEI